MNFLGEFFRAVGVVGYILVPMSLAAIAIIVERFMAYRQLGDTAPDLVTEVVRRVRGGDLNGALDLARKRQGPVAAVIVAILSSRGASAGLIEGRVQEVANEYAMRLERLLPFVDTTTTLSPLLGLVGTIVGMIRVFNQFRGASGNSSQQQQLLGGVGEALYATTFGITLALICFAAYNYFSARQRSIMAETEQAATRVLNAVAEAASATAGERGTGRITQATVAATPAK
jgi:biopolymer transport protein ExbB